MTEKDNSKHHIDHKSIDDAVYAGNIIDTEMKKGNYATIAYVMNILPGNKEPLYAMVAMGLQDYANNLAEKTALTQQGSDKSKEVYSGLMQIVDAYKKLAGNYLSPKEKE